MKAGWRGRGADGQAAIAAIGLSCSCIQLSLLPFLSRSIRLPPCFFEASMPTACALFSAPSLVAQWGIVKSLARPPCSRLSLPTLPPCQCAVGHCEECGQVGGGPAGAQVQGKPPSCDAAWRCGGWRPGFACSAVGRLQPCRLLGAASCRNIRVFCRLQGLPPERISTDGGARATLPVSPAIPRASVPCSAGAAARGVPRRGGRGRRPPQDGPAGAADRAGEPLALRCSARCPEHYFSGLPDTGSGLEQHLYITHTPRPPSLPLRRARAARRGCLGCRASRPSARRS